MLTLNDIFRNINDIIIVKDKDGNIVYYNKPYDEFSDLISNNKDQEIYLEKSSNWFNISSKPIDIDDNTYSLMMIKNITKYKQREKVLYEQGLSDYLTGLYNRQGIVCGLNEFIQNYKKTHKSFTVIMSDIDYFKQINDTYGHQVGDNILYTVGSILKSNIRESDFVGRYGGEEFLIVLSSNNIPQIRKRIEQIRKAVEDYKFIPDHDGLNLTMTFGIQTYDGKSTIEEIINQADQALYYGKKNGRNQIILYNDVKNELDYGIDKGKRQ